MNDPRTLAALLLVADQAIIDAGLVAADFIEVVVPLYDAWLAARPPCPTCGGSGWFIEPGGKEMTPCSDCPDGIQPFNKWTAGLPTLDSQRNRAILQAVADHALPDSPVSEDIRSFCEYLLTSPLGGAQ